MTNLEVIDEKLNGVVSDVDDIKKTMKNLANAVNQLAVLEVKHVEMRESMKRAFTEIGKNNDAIRQLQISQPVLKLSSKWVFSAVLGVIGLLGTIAVALIVQILIH